LPGDEGGSEGFSGAAELAAQLWPITLSLSKGERSGFSQQYISKLEQGRRNPTVVTLYELANALGVSHVELVKPD
jgi:transcriptional regulator with XRE-family HTH domain